MAYLDKTGLTYFWSKIKTLLNNKANKSHTHTLDDVSETTSKKIMTSAERTKLSGIATVATSGKYSDLSGTPTSLPANGGNADTVGGYGLRVVTDVNDTGKAGYITIIK